MDSWFDCKKVGLEEYQMKWNGDVMNKRTGKILKKQTGSNGHQYTQVKSKYKFYDYDVRKQISINYFGKSNAEDEILAYEKL